MKTISKASARHMCISAGLTRKTFSRLKLRERMTEDSVKVLINQALKMKARYEVIA